MYSLNLVSPCHGELSKCGKFKFTGKIKIIYLYSTWVKH